MAENCSKATLISIWEQHRNRIVRYGHALHALLPEGEPPITLHGRDLRPPDEGVGIQFQYMLADSLYDGEVVTACYVVQLALIAGTSIRAKVDVTPLLEYRDGHFEVFDRRSAMVRFHDTQTLRTFFADSLTRTASRFFSTVRAGERWNECAAVSG